MRILVCGGRSYYRYRDLEQFFYEFRKDGEITEVIHGNASGCDLLADQYFRYEKIPVTVVPADWKTHGKAAGVIRNKKMLELKPDLVVAFPGGAGTQNMVKIAKEAGIDVIETEELE